MSLSAIFVSKDMGRFELYMERWRKNHPCGIPICVMRMRNFLIKNARMRNALEPVPMWYECHEVSYAGTYVG